MRHKKIQLATLLSLILIFPAFSQSIGTMSWIPQNPTTSDNVKLLVPVSFPNSTCSKTSQFVNKNNVLSIVVDGYYCAENAGSCTRTDTFDLGQLVAGNVKVQFNLSGPHQVNGCQGFQLAAIKSDTIQVSSATGISTSEMGYSLMLFPNPNTGSFNLEFALAESNDESRVVFYNIYGEEIKAVSVNGSGSIKMNENWESGYYFYRLESGSQKSNLQKLVVVR